MLAVANVEQLESVQLIVVNVYDDTGFLSDQVIRKFEGYEQALKLLNEVKATHVYTSDRELFGLLIQSAGIGVELKHRHATTDTRRAVEQHVEILTELYGIEPSVPLPELAGWRRWVCNKLSRLIEIIGGGLYDS